MAQTYSTQWRTEAEVAKLQHAVPRQQHVLRFDVPVDDLRDTRIYALDMRQNPAAEIVQSHRDMRTR
jgi:hypothetical protein